MLHPEPPRRQAPGAADRPGASALVRLPAVAVQRVSHVGVCVSCLERSLPFYRDLLGFREVGRLEMAGEPAATLLELPAVKLRAAYLERDGTCLELLEYPAPGHVGQPVPRPMNALGLSHVSLRVADLAALLPRVEAAGGRVLAHSRIAIPEARTAAVFVADPDGTRIELVESPGDPARKPGA